jgi:hypothetical protein
MFFNIRRNFYEKVTFSTPLYSYITNFWQRYIKKIFLQKQMPNNDVNESVSVDPNRSALSSISYMYVPRSTQACMPRQTKLIDLIM